MANTMPVERCEDLSIYYWLKGLFSDTPFVTIVDGFPEENIVIPSISVEWDDLSGYEFELGNRNFLKERFWQIDIFAKTKSQRDDFAFRIFDALQNVVPVYNYNEGFPSAEFSPSRNGTIIPIKVRVRNLHKFLEEDLSDQPEEVYFRAVVQLTATFDNH